MVGDLTSSMFYGPSGWHISFWMVLFYFFVRFVFSIRKIRTHLFCFNLPIFFVVVELFAILSVLAG